MNLNRVMFDIMYSYPKLGVMDEYFDVRALLLNSASSDVLEDINANGKSAVTRWAKKVASDLLGERKIINGIKESIKVLPDSAVNILNGIVVTNNGPDGNALDGNYAYFPLQGYFAVVIKKQRGAIFEGYINAEHMKTCFKLQNLMAIYGNEDYSIAFRAYDNSFGFAIMYSDSLFGVKGSKMLIVSYFDSYAYYIDDASKYRDVKAFGQGL